MLFVREVRNHKMLAVCAATFSGLDVARPQASTQPHRSDPDLVDDRFREQKSFVRGGNPGG